MALGLDRTFQGNKGQLGAGKGEKCGAEELMVSHTISGDTAGDTTLLLPEVFLHSPSPVPVSPPKLGVPRPRAPCAALGKVPEARPWNGNPVSQEMLNLIVTCPRLII